MIKQKEIEQESKANENKRFQLLTTSCHVTGAFLLLHDPASAVSSDLC